MSDDSLYFIGPAISMRNKCKDSACLYENTLIQKIALKLQYLFLSIYLNFSLRPEMEISKKKNPQASL
jgi:hypothetical protein